MIRMFFALLIGGCAVDLGKGGITTDTAGNICIDYDSDGSCQNAYCNPEGSCFQPDCNDADPDTHPGAEEVCDGLDNDCDEGPDEGLGGRNIGLDGDLDGYAGAASPIEWSCEVLDVGEAEVTPENVLDCDDTNSAVNPGAVEMCDTVDNDCDMAIDEEGGAWYRDADNDSYGTIDDMVTICVQPPGYSASSWDCNDADPNISPGQDEICLDTIDNDCDTEIDETSDCL